MSNTRHNPTSDYLLAVVVTITCLALIAPTIADVKLAILTTLGLIAVFLPVSTCLYAVTKLCNIGNKIPDDECGDY